ncbi:OmpH family outer membrane protein [Geomonas subterranea]|uniref:OmpH family outer membrane protein n=1 Tax=Geomonas subterranea TaxID=2847989 RepID=A0ABX8LJ17_9BACT|nr:MULTISPECIES: OmpH family outer membrane protein [Geomonas]QXE92031.1 OmpH family outer membrane protein [Geomonas subterranea]QXM09876.1 OmpH family outer membrane protein [Geomonas subterranea]
MTRFVTLLIGSALASLIASNGFAADAAPVAAPAATPAAAPAAAPALAPAAVVAPAPPAKDEANSATIKVAFIDMAKVAAESPEGKAASESLKKKSEQLRNKLDAKTKQLEKQKAAIEAKLPTMTQKERAAKAAEFQKKVEEYQKLARNSELEVNKLQDKLTNEIGGMIKKAASDYARANGYLLVVEEKGVLFTDEKVKPKDISDEVAAELGKKGKK